MGFEYFYGQNILKSQADAIIIPVNTVGIIGTGLAKKAAIKYPEIVIKYKEYCARSLLQVGKPQVVTNPRKVILFPSKKHWRDKPSIEWVSSGLKTLRKQDGMFTSIAMPPIGCGFAGLMWSDVENEIKFYFEDSLCEIHIYCKKR